MGGGRKPGVNFGERPSLGLADPQTKDDRFTIDGTLNGDRCRTRLMFKESGMGEREKGLPHRRDGLPGQSVGLDETSRPADLRMRSPAGVRHIGQRHRPMNEDLRNRLCQSHVVDHPPSRGGECDCSAGGLRHG